MQSSLRRGPVNGEGNALHAPHRLWNEACSRLFAGQGENVLGGHQPWDVPDCDSAPVARSARPEAWDSDFLAGLDSLHTRKFGGRAAFVASTLLHALVIGTGLIAPLVGIEMPELPLDPVKVLIYDPPPPPPQPLPLGSGLGHTPRRSEPREPEVTRPEPRLNAPAETPAPVPVETPAPDAALAGGSEAGHPLGMPEGMESGIPGGVVGGVPGGVLGGVIGGTGDVPVQPVDAPDRPPRLLRLVKPHYPSEAFVKKLEGTVGIEIVIDAHGSVVRARVVQSVPGLDEPALEAVRQWLFTPAIHQGRPVAARALAPVTFRIY